MKNIKLIVKRKKFSNIGDDCTLMLTKYCPQRSSSFSNIKHATQSTAKDAVEEMGGAPREMK